MPGSPGRQIVGVGAGGGRDWGWVSIARAGAASALSLVRSPLDGVWTGRSGLATPVQAYQLEAVEFSQVVSDARLPAGATKWGRPAIRCLLSLLPRICSVVTIP